MKFLAVMVQKVQPEQTDRHIDTNLSEIITFPHQRIVTRGSFFDFTIVIHQHKEIS